MDTNFVSAFSFSQINAETKLPAVTVHILVKHVLIVSKIKYLNVACGEMLL